MHPSTYYYKSDASEKKKQQDILIRNEIEKIIELLPQSGYRSVTVILNRTIKIGKKLVSRIMRENGLNCRHKRVYKPSTTDSNHRLPKYENLLLNEKFNKMPTIVGDVTYFDILGKNHYCAHLLDLVNREPIGIAISDRLDSELVCSALQMAIQNRGELKNYIHHTDTDSRYCSGDYIKLLESTGAKISMCKGNAYENAHSESFNGTLKRQEINLNEYKSKEEAANGIFAYIEKYINIRPHSALGMLTPLEYGKKVGIYT